MTGYGSRRWLSAALLLAVLTASLGLAAASSPPSGMARTGRAMGRAGFAYLGGLRTFAAAILWNRTEPVFHEYYASVPLAEQRYLIPTLRLVVLLDPQFVQAYYVSSFMVGRMVGEDAGIALAREGARENPSSGLMQVNLAQLLFVKDKEVHRDEILERVSRSLDAKATWIDDEERYEGYLIAAQMLKSLGRLDAAQRVNSALEAMRAAGIGLGDHDHDGDGIQDH